jgi:hypothetical protein
MEILADRIAKFTSTINPQDWISLIEEVAKTYPLEEVSRRPHLTMELPNFLCDTDSQEAVYLRSEFLKKVYNPIQQYMSTFGIDNMELKKKFITVSKLTAGGMGIHKDDKNQDRDNFICMFYLNDDYAGGELLFPDFDIKYKPNAGDIIIYQSKFQHGVTDLISGNRYNIGIGFKGPIQSN